MKTLILAVLIGVITLGQAQAADWENEYAVLLRKYVSPAGVRYAPWKRDAGDVAALQRVVDGIAAARRKDLAFYLNAYNAWILHEALAKYPTRSVKDALFTFFLTERLTVAGQKLSFNKLEKEIIRERFKEPRIHFALNCASRSCPPLASEPYQSGDLNAQLESAARGFINSERGVRTNKDAVALSKIFDWYKEDFGGAGGVIAFINQRRSAKIPADAKITYQEYNWNLNEAK